MRLQVEQRAVEPGWERDELINIEWNGDRGDWTCPSCSNVRKDGMPLDGHAVDCRLKRIIDSPPGGSVLFTRSTPVDPTATGCNACALHGNCKRLDALDDALRKHGEDFHGIVNGALPPGASTAKRLMTTHALVAETCELFRERTE